MFAKQFIKVRSKQVLTVYTFVQFTKFDFPFTITPKRTTNVPAA